MTRYLIVATPRSATAFTARLLTNLGLNCGHEKYFKLETHLARFLDDAGVGGDSSWLAMPFISQLPDDVRILHQLRHPLKVIKSLLELQFVELDATGQPVREGVRRAFTEFAVEHCPEVRAYHTDLERAAWFYYHWNRKIEACCGGREVLRYRVDELDTGLLRQVLSFIGVDGAQFTDEQLAAQLADVPRDVNAKMKDKVVVVDEVTWAALPAPVCELARSYGYVPDDPATPTSGNGIDACDEAFERVREQVHRTQLDWRDERERHQARIARLQPDGVDPGGRKTTDSCDQAFERVRERIHAAQLSWRSEREQFRAELAGVAREVTDLRRMVRELQTHARTAQHELRQARREAKESREKLDTHWRQRTEKLNAALEEAQQRARAAAEQCARLGTARQQLDAELKQVRRESDLARRAVDVEQGRLRAAQELLEKTQAELNAEREANKSLDQRLRKLSKERADQARIERRAQHLADDVQRLKAELALREQEVRYRLGDALVKALRPSKNTLMLPARMGKLFFEGLRRRRARRLEGASTRTASPTPRDDDGRSRSGAPAAVSSGKRTARTHGAKRAASIARGWAAPQRPGTVSVIMTTYNSARYVRNAVDSILEQTHRNLELIVVDDASSDNTMQIIQEYIERDPRVRLLRSFENRGTYWCKNLGLTQATGSYVAFQDSDDISNRERLALQLAELRRHPEAVACRCNYVRQNEHGVVVLNRGMPERRALIGILFKREQVLERVGYFDSVRTSGDEEHYQRLQIAFGGGSIVHLEAPLYIALLRDGSLTTNTRTGSAISGPTASEHGESLPADREASFLSEPRRRYVEAYRKWHDEIRAGREQPCISFPQLRRPFPAPTVLLPSREPGEGRITASVASIASRQEALRQVVEAILPQVDQLNVFLNNYERAPGFLEHPRIRIARSQEHGDLRDNGKFFFADRVDGYHFTIDDDIHYPPDYVQRCILKLMQYGHGVVVGSHGVVLADPLDRFLKDRRVFHFEEANGYDRLVNLLGTGAVAYHTTTLSLSFSDFGEPGMADLWFALAAKRQKIPLVAIEHPGAWLASIPVEGQSLYDEFCETDEVQTRVAREAQPWVLEALVPDYDPRVAEMLGWGPRESPLRAQPAPVEYSP